MGEQRRWAWLTAGLVGLVLPGLLPPATSAAPATPRPAPSCFGSFSASATEGDQAAAVLHYLTDVRAAGHRCHDRAVFELEPRGHGGPFGYRVEYGDQSPAEPGRGRSVPVEGDAALLVRLNPARDVRFNGADPRPTYRGPSVVRPDGARHVTEVRHIGSFEGTVTWAIGLREQRPYRVIVLSSPKRLVIDVG